MGTITIIVLYMLPTFICAIKGRNYTFLVGVLNLFLGWTLIGWFVCLGISLL